jgi:hypothetical protein
MIMKNLLIITAAIILITSCSDESSIFDPTYFSDGFKGITFTGENDPTPFKSDPSDWCTNEEGPIGNFLVTYSFYPAYPNPVTLGSTTTLSFAIPQDSHVYLYVINKEYRIIRVLMNTDLYAGVYQIYLDTNGIGAAGVYRVVFETENLYCKGDVWIRN